MRRNQYAIAGFEDGAWITWAKERGQPLEADKHKNQLLNNLKHFVLKHTWIIA